MIRKPNTDKPCPKCKGEGYVKRLPTDKVATVQCPNCGGSGKVKYWTK
jgi:DnaJ-class molecular chaperone